MIWQLDIALLGLAVLCALCAVTVKDLLASVILLGAFSLFMCLAYTCIRPGEARALRIGDYDWKTGALEVTRALKTLSGERPVYGPTKTGEEGTYTLLREARTWLESNVPLERRIRTDLPLYPTPQTGTPYSHDTLLKKWRQACAKAEVDYLPLYRSTKHTGLTALAEAGIGLREIQSMARHSDPSTTQVYLVEDQQSIRRAQDALAELLDGAKGERDVSGEGE